MKRSIHPTISDRTPSRRRRTLSEEERALWDSVARQLKPLKKHRPLKSPAAPHCEAPSVNQTVAFKAASAAPARRAAKPAIPPLAPIGRRERTKLSRGRMEIEARLDLHGMTQTRAHRALSGFLQRAHREGLAFVLVITGKGRTGGETGVLRRQVPEWLGLPEFRAFVVGFEEAHTGHGGEGALYVRIRRAKP